MKKENLKKIIIIGDAGRGKTTLAKKISKKLGIKHHSTDDHYYEIKFHKIRNKEKSIESISKICSNDKWIIEGTTRHLLEPGLDSADMIIYLKYNSIFPQWLSLVKRHFQRKDETLPELLRLMRHVFYKRYKLGYKKGRMTHAELLEPHKHKVVVLSSFEDIDDFEKSL